MLCRPPNENIMVIDGAGHCVYGIFTAPDDDFALILGGPVRESRRPRPHETAA
jgi:hypothetical protein